MATILNIGKNFKALCSPYWMCTQFSPMDSLSSARSRGIGCKLCLSNFFPSAPQSFFGFQVSGNFFFCVWERTLCAHVCTTVWRSEVTIGVSPQSLSILLFFFYLSKLSLSLSPTASLGPGQASKSQRPSFLHLCCVGRCDPPQTAFSCGH